MPASLTLSCVARGMLLIVLLAGLLANIPVPSANAQTPPAISLHLVGQPAWHRPDDLLDLKVRVSNEGPGQLTGFKLQVAAYSRSTSRSDLHDNFEVDPLTINSSALTAERPDIDVAPGSSAVVEIDSPVSGLTSLIGGDSGVYPITITLADVDGFTALDSVTTQLIYFTEEVEVPLNLVLSWPITDLPSRRAGGAFFSAGPDEPSSLEAATAPDGWLTGIILALESPVGGDELRAGFAPSPRLIEELADMADGFRRVEGDVVVSVSRNDPASQAASDALEGLRDLASRPGLQPLHTPYAFPDLTAIDDFEQMTGQLTASEAVLEEELGVPPDSGWLFAPAGRLDEITLERLHSSAAAASTFFSENSLGPPSLDVPTSCREDFLGTPYTCPIKVPTTSGRSRGYVLDAELQQRFAALVSAPANLVEMQKLFAELAMVWAELPGTSDRVIALAVPPLWHPPSWVSERFVRTMARGPWLRTRTPREGLHLGIGAIERELVADAPPLLTEPDETYLQAVDGAAAVIESFARIRPPVELVQRLRRDVLLGRSLLWWSDDPTRVAMGADFSADARAEAESEFKKLSIVGNRQITLTSRRGTLPLSLQNLTDYPVTLEVLLESNDRDLDLSQRELTQTFEPGSTPIPVQVTARASGAYPVGVRVTAPDGYEIFFSSVSIRSTEFNEIAVGITLGALTFLVLFTAFRTVKRRRSNPEGSETAE